MAAPEINKKSPDYFSLPSLQNMNRFICDSYKYNLEGILKPVAVSLQLGQECKGF